MDEFLAHVPMAAAVLIIGLVLIIVTRKPLASLVDRVRSVRHGETSLEMGPQAEQQQAQLSEVPPPRGLLRASAIDPSVMNTGGGTVVESTDSASGAGQTPNERASVLRTVGLSPLVIDRETIIRKDVDHLPTIEERERLLIRNLAIAQLELAAERTYRVIFGSQLAALQHLNLYGPTPKEKLERLFYEPAAQKFGEVYRNYPADRYFHFMASNGLITISDGGDVAVTVAGKALLEWIIRHGVLMNKPF
jgi:hypothetical protein